MSADDEARDDVYSRLEWYTRGAVKLKLSYAKPA